MKKIAYDSIKLDALKIVQDSKCCLKVNAVISKAGVYLYKDGWALKSKNELLKASNAIRFAGAKLTLHKHPDSKVIMSQSQLYGGIENAFFDRDKIRATLNFDKALTPSPLLQQIREAINHKTGLDVSIGFYYEHNLTSGFATDVNTGAKRWYDYVMRDILIDHVAVMFEGDPLRGRCTYPNCGIGVDSLMKTISYHTDKVVKRGSQYCVVHCHPDGSIGDVIKCFPTKEQAEAMHRAIQARQHSSSLQGYVTNLWESYFAQIDQDKRPPKDWWDNCIAEVTSGNPQYTEQQAAATCANIWYHKTEQKGIGDSNQKGVKKMSETEAEGGEVTESTFQKCVSERVSQGWTEEAAKDYCAAATTPGDEPTPTDQATPQEPPKETGGAQEAPSDEAVEKTEIERCIENYKDSHPDASEDEAKQWCIAEQQGEHVTTDSLVKRSQELLNLKEQHDIERLRQSRRHPV